MRERRSLRSSGERLCLRAKPKSAREREEAGARNRYLKKLAKREPKAWRQIETLVATRRPGDYDAAITLLKDLRELGARKGRSADVTRRIRALREAQATKPSFLERLRRAGL